ncbi:hypothetical protein [Psychroserpens sp. MEBiC05023]
MKLPWLLIAMTIGFIFVAIQNKKQLKSSFYNDLNLSQLENELFKLLDEILDLVDPSSDFSNVEFDDFEAFDKEIAKYKAGIIDRDALRLDFLKEEFSHSGGFKILADNNGWSIEFKSISQRFSILYDAYINY